MPKYVCKAKGRQRARKTGKLLVSVVSRSAAAGVKAAGVYSLAWPTPPSETTAG